MLNPRPPNHFRPVALWITLCVAGALSVSPVFADSRKFWTEKDSTAAPSASHQQNMALTLFSDLAEKLSPAVVNIRALEKVPVQPYWDYPWGGGPMAPPNSGGEQLLPRGEGSGFFITADGYILTNAHVIFGSDQLQVALNDGRLFRARIVGIDDVMDVGLIKVEGNGPFPVLPLGSSDKLRIGEWVMAIGSPFGLQSTVTVGIVSGKGRFLGTGPFDDFIQIDAPINPGNSGGPLINTNGEVVGINTMILAAGQGLGFSLPIDLVKQVLPQLKARGYVERSWMGLVVQEITIDLKERLGLKVGQGAYVVQVVHNSPAAKSGLKEGDVIIEFNGKPIRHSRELPLLSANSPAGVPLPFKAIRNGKIITLEVTLQKTPQSKM